MDITHLFWHIDGQTAEVYITCTKKIEGQKDIGKVFPHSQSFILQMKDYNYILK